MLPEAIFGKGNSEGDAWYESKRRVLLEDVDGSEKIYRSLSYFQKRDRYTKDRKAALSKEVVFFRNNRDRMEYQRFRDNGWPIGSGLIEAACKSVVKCRLCRSGMRWTRTGGQAILTLRAILKSNRWDAFWSLYKNPHFAQLTNAAA